MTEQVEQPTNTERKLSTMTEDNTPSNLIQANTPRVQRSELVESGEIFTLNSWDTADGKTRLLMPMDCTDEEFMAAEEALKESDETLATLKKLKNYTDSIEGDEEVIVRCNTLADDSIRVSYRRRGGDNGWSEAFVSESTGEGVDAISNVPVVLRLQEDDDEFKGEWLQLDPWKWRFVAQQGWVRFE